MSDNPQYSDPSSERSVEKPKSSTAIISLIAGILGLTVVPVVGSIIAVLTGSIATKEIAESGGELAGEGMAQVGKILGWIGIGLTVLSICFAGLIIAFSLCMVAIGVSESWGSLLPLVVAFI